LPSSWGNPGRGGINIHEEGNTVLISAYLGQRELQISEMLHYDFEMLITPFKTMSNEIKYGYRYYHGGRARGAYGKLEAATNAGANMLLNSRPFTVFRGN
jgi:hypothetical protein